MAESPENLKDLIEKIAAEVAATEVAAFAVEPDSIDGYRIDPLLHIRPGDADKTTRSAAVAAFRDIVLPCVEHSKDGVIEIDDTDDGHGKQYCLVTLARREAMVAGAAAFIVHVTMLKMPASL